MILRSKRWRRRLRQRQDAGSDDEASGSPSSQDWVEDASDPGSPCTPGTPFAHPTPFSSFSSFLPLSLPQYFTSSTHRPRAKAPRTPRTTLEASPLGNGATVEADRLRRRHADDNAASASRDPPPQAAWKAGVGLGLASRPVQGQVWGNAGPVQGLWMALGLPSRPMQGLRDSAGVWESSPPFRVLHRLHRPLRRMLLLLLAAVACCAVADWNRMAGRTAGLIGRHARVTRQSASELQGKGALPGALVSPNDVELPSGQLKSRGVSVTIFCAPKAFESVVGTKQRMALLSWLRLHPTPKIVFFGRHPSLQEVATEFSPHVSLDSQVDLSFRGIPLLNSMIARASQAPTQVSLIVSADVILLQDVLTAMAKLFDRRRLNKDKNSNNDDNKRNNDSSSTSHWLMTGMRWDVRNLPFTFRQDPSVPFQLHPAVQIRWRNASLASDDDVIKYVTEYGQLHSFGGLDFFAWDNAPGVPLVEGPVPPFAFGKGKYDNWIVHEAVASGRRFVVDATHVATSIHVHHGFQGVRDNQTLEEAGVGPWALKGRRTFETHVNVYLSQNFGSSFANQKGTAMHTPWKLAKCYDPRGSPSSCLLPRPRPGNCSCEESPFTASDQQAVKRHPKMNSTWTCGYVAPNRAVVIRGVASDKTERGLPHTLRHLLFEVAPNASSTVVLTGVSAGYLPLLRNFACQLSSLGVLNLIVAAFDEESYVGALQQGLAVFLEPSTWQPNAAGDPPHLGCSPASPCVPSQLAQFKARAVQAVIRTGHSCLWSDVDVVWRANPLELLTQHLLPPGEEPAAVFLAASAHTDRLSGGGSSTAAGAKEATGHTEMIDAGFFFLPATQKSDELMAAVAAEAQSGLGTSEQTLYQDKLCGPQLERFDRTIQECVTGESLRAILVDNSLSRVKTETPLEALLHRAGLRHSRGPRDFAVLHVGQFQPVEAIIGLLKQGGMWQYDEAGLMCMRTWKNP